MTITEEIAGLKNQLKQTETLYAKLQGIIEYLEAKKAQEEEKEEKKTSKKDKSVVKKK